MRVARKAFRFTHSWLEKVKPWRGVDEGENGGEKLYQSLM